jgi:hypothetical protein
MSTLSIRIPDSLHASVKRFSKEDHISINQFIASAVAEKITALETENYLNDRATSGSKDRFNPHNKHFNLIRLLSRFLVRLESVHTI